MLFLDLDCNLKYPFPWKKALSQFLLILPTVPSNWGLSSNHWMQEGLWKMHGHTCSRCVKRRLQGQGITNTTEDLHFRLVFLWGPYGSLSVTLLKLTALKNRGKGKVWLLKLIFHSCIPFESSVEEMDKRPWNGMAKKQCQHAKNMSKLKWDFLCNFQTMWTLTQNWVHVLEKESLLLLNACKLSSLLGPKHH